jgi:hypothetical protein
MIDISWKQALLGVTAMAMTAAVIRPSAFEQPVTVTSAVVTPAPTPQAKVVVEKHTLPVQPDGYMSEKDCARIPNGMQVADLVYKYGWPASDYAISRFADRFFYPIHDADEDRCVIEYDNNKVVSTLYRDE